MTDDIKYKLLNEYSKDFDILEDNIDDLRIKGDIHLRHKACGTEYTTKLYIFLRESSRKYGCCPKCKIKKNRTDKEFRDEVFKKFGNEWSILSTYTSNTTKIKVKHNICNSKEYEITPKDLLRKAPNSKCKYCSKRLEVIGLENKLAKRSDASDYEILSGQKYENNKSEIYIKHLVCGNTFTTTSINFFGTKNRVGRRCPYCFNNFVDTNIFKERVYNLVGDEYTVLSEYNKSDEKIKMRHNKCGHEYYVTPTAFTSNGNRCPVCSPIKFNKSYKEKEVANFIKSLNFDIIENKRFYKEGKHYLEADILIESKKIIIEFDGLYWHTETESSKYNILEKTNFFNKLGYRVIHIFEDEWINKQDIVKNKLKNILGCSTDKIFARGCTIKEISAKEKSIFLNENHLQGNDRANISIGLFNNETLIAVMTFCKKRGALGSLNKTGWELSRFATSRTVVGGFSKLLKYAIVAYDLNDIVTYADLRWSSLDNVYSKNGFTMDHISAPGYFYIDRHKTKRFHRYNFRKQVLKSKFPNVYDDSKSEKEIMRLAGYHILYDCGNAVYRLK